MQKTLIMKFNYLSNAIKIYHIFNETILGTE